MSELEIEDWELVQRVQDNEDEDALNELCVRHSGIFISMVKRFGKKMTQTERYDLIDEKVYHIYQAAKKYDKEKSKFSTFLASQTIYNCFGINNKKNKNNTINFDDISFQEEDKSSFPDEEISNKEIFFSILDEIEKLDDNRAKIILKERYFSSKDFKLKTWNKIADDLGMSVQGCIDIHDKFLKKMNKKLIKKDEIKFRRTNKFS